jgi:predicted RNA binding protein YcfA (HicA-like mRNA interferase family)
VAAAEVDRGETPPPKSLVPTGHTTAHSNANLPKHGHPPEAWFARNFLNYGTARGTFRTSEREPFLVVRTDKLLAKARNATGSLSFNELCRLAEGFGFVQVRQKGSHVAFHRSGLNRPMIFQNRRGSAVAYQVKQLLSALTELGLIDD